MRFDYLIIGGGMTADAAARGIRELDAAGSIGIVGNDPDPPYTRPALTKKLWTDPSFSMDDNWLWTADATGAKVMTSTTALAIDPKAHVVQVHDGGRLEYGRLLLAMGGVPIMLDLPPSNRALYFRTFADYVALRRLSGDGRNIAVVGGSFIGTELAAALAQNNTRATLVYPDDVLGAPMFPLPLARQLEATYKAHGVELLRNTQFVSGRTDDTGVVAHFSDGTERRFDGVVFGLGITPCVALAESAGLNVGDGIIVDDRLYTGTQDIYAAGDVACYPDSILGRRRVEHVDNARHMGFAAGRILAGSEETYHYTPYFYSKVFDISWQAVGTLDSSLETVCDWFDPPLTGAVYYLRDAKAVGVLLWNGTNRLDAARAVLADTELQTASTLMGRI